MKKVLLGLVVLGVILAFSNSNASATLIFSDNFNRADSDTVGNGWSEIQNDANDVAVRDNHLRLRDEMEGNPDAAIYRMISLSGYQDVTLDFDWNEYSDDSESDDYLYANWRLGAGSWNQVFSTGLGGSSAGSFTTAATIDLPSSVDGQANFWLRFWTDVSQDDEGALLDNIALNGSPIETQGVPEPASMLLLSLGLLGFGALRRKRA